MSKKANIQKQNEILADFLRCMLFLIFASYDRFAYQDL